MPRGTRRSSVQKVDYVLFYLRLLYSTITHHDESLIHKLLHKSRVLRRMIGIRFYRVQHPLRTEDFVFWRDCESVLSEIDDTSDITRVTEITLPPLLSTIRDYLGITLDECRHLLKYSLILRKISVDTYTYSHADITYYLYFIICRGSDGQFYSISCSSHGQVYSITSDGYFDIIDEKYLRFDCSFRVFQFLDPGFCPFPEQQETFSMPQIVKHMVEFWSVREIVTSIKQEEGLLQFRKLPYVLLQIILSYLQ
jgi:hypothetical protein